MTVFPISHVSFLLLQGVTNYLHLIGAGHLLYYLKLYGNLYPFSQQGWEALNKLIKSQYHCKSNHGGCLGNNNSAMIRGRQLLSTANLLTRRFCWLTRIGQEFFQGMEQCLPCMHPRGASGRIGRARGGNRCQEKHRVQGFLSCYR